MDHDTIIIKKDIKDEYISLIAEAIFKTKGTGETSKVRVVSENLISDVCL